jgi:MoxR-like ATPase
MLDTRLIRLQCYEGLDVYSAVYEWNYARQILQIRLLEAEGASDKARIEKEIFSQEFLIERPLLQSIKTGPGEKAPVLLIDELDRADEPFEAFLLEILADYQITIPELGTIRASEPPITIITSNRTREVHDAVRRRCFYVWIDYPTAARESEILALKVPNAAAALTAQIVAFVQSIRQMDLYKNPGIAESINWAQALTSLDCVALEPEDVNSTLGALLKYQDDIARIQGGEAARILEKVKSNARQQAFDAQAGG